MAPHAGGRTECPGVIVFSDVTLREIASRLPTTLEEFSGIPGVGAVKLADFGRIFIEEVARPCRRGLRIGPMGPMSPPALSICAEG